MYNIQGHNLKGIIFDLDNVLYNETGYVFAAYHEISLYISENYKIDKEYIYTKLVNYLKEKTSMYPRLFNDLLSELGLNNKLLTTMLEIYSSVQPQLELFEGAEPLLSELKERHKLGLLTNGRIETQKNKVKLLDIERLFDEILYARELGEKNEKPNTLAYKVLLERLKIDPEDAVCIGDNPYTDFIGAKKIGLLTVRVLTGEFKDVVVDKEHGACITVKDLREFKNLLKNEG